MLTMTPTQLRRQLFASLRRVVNGDQVVVTAKGGNVVLAAEKRRGRSSLAAATGAKIPGGRVLLDDADVSLRKHLILPK